MRKSARPQHGFTLIEVLIASILLVLFVVPAMQAMTAVTHSATEAQLARQSGRLLRDKLDEVLSLPFETLASAAGDPGTASSYSDPVDVSPRRLVYVSHYDGDATGSLLDVFDVDEVDADMLWVKVVYSDRDSPIETLVYR